MGVDVKIDRSQVEIVLADATVDPVSRWHVNDTFNRELVAELARAWLALDAAPEVFARGQGQGWSGGGQTSVTFDGVFTVDLLKHYRLVATPTTRGPSE